MVTLLFTAILIIGLVAIALYFWAPRAKSFDQSSLHPHNPPRGLFSDENSFESLSPAPKNPNEIESKAERISLSERAKAGDKRVLKEAQGPGDQTLYNQLLDQFTVNADNAPTLLALASYVTRNELPVNKKLVEAVIKSWKDSPDRSSTATTLHLTALADDADLYQTTVETALCLWRQRTLADISAAELRALFDGEFWVLSANTRNSGAGFVLKRSLANARRELETAMRVN